jgi:TraM recognition site of TraD and TraG
VSDRTYFSNDINLGLNGDGRSVVLQKERRGRHTICLGVTGAGKSKWLEYIIRQDLLAYHRSQCGVAVFDPHGKLYDNLLAFAASKGLDHLPVIPFDCRRLDWLVSFNPLKARSNIESDTIISGCMESLLFAWDQWTTNPTPRLEKWLRFILHMVFFSGGTLSDSLAILRNPDLRKSLARAIEDDVARTVWQTAACYKESEFQNMTESLCNRVLRFVSNTLLKLSLNQVGPSLDFGTVMQKGGIVLISLATAGGVIDEVDARTIGSLLMHGIWRAAKLRGKGESGQQKSFRVYMDEFGRFLTPTMAEGLAEARGFGLEFFLCTQSTSRLRSTPAGQQVLDAVLANSRTKIIFNVQHPQDVDLLTPWLFRNEVNPNQIKHQHYATRVLGHRIEYLEATNRTVARGTADNATWSITENASDTVGGSFTHTDAIGTAKNKQRSHTVSAGRRLTEGSGKSHGVSAADSEQAGETRSKTAGRVRQQSESEGETRHLDGDYDSLQKVTGPEPTATFDEAFTDEDENHRALNRTVDKTKTKTKSDSDTETAGLAATRSKSKARAVQDIDSNNKSLSLDTVESDTEGDGTTVSVVSTDGETQIATTTTGTADTKGGGHTDSLTTSVGVTKAPMLMPILGKEALPPVFRSVDEQMFIFSQFLTAEPDRHAVVRIGIDPPVQITSPTIEPARITAKGAQAWATMKLKKLEFALTFTEATQRIDARQKMFEEKYLGSLSTDEPTRTVHRLKETKLCQ